MSDTGSTRWEPTKLESAHSVFLAWERLRIIYNAVLTFLVLSFGAPFLGERAFWRFTLGAAVLANLCFCFGPVAEGYMSWFGADRRAVRGAIFVFGTMLGCFLTLVALFTWGLRGID